MIPVFSISHMVFFLLLSLLLSLFYENQLNAELLDWDWGPSCAATRQQAPLGPLSAPARYRPGAEQLW